MDSDKFDQQLMGYLFDELDEVDRAAVKRRLETDGVARELATRLRTTLDRAQLQLEEPSPELEARILEAARLAERGEPVYRKLLRFLAWAGSHAMRPQFAMGALLVVVLGSSMLLLRAKPGAMRTAQEGRPATQMTAVNPASTQLERGNPLPPSLEGEPAAAPAMAADGSKGSREGASTGVEEDDGAFARGMKKLTAGQAADAQLDFTAASRAGGKNGPKAALYAARAARAAGGCKEAIPYFRKLRERYGESGYGADAMFEEAQCRHELDERAQAQELLTQLQSHPEYRTRATAELARENASGATAGGAAAPGAKSKPAAAGSKRKTPVPTAPSGSP